VSHISESQSAFDKYRTRSYFPELDGIRAICVLGVLAHHMTDKHVWHWLGGGLGVNVFFVLSGYLITMLALREERTRGKLSFKAFYVRRTLRIFPLYYFAVIVYCGLIAVGWSRELRDNFIQSLPYYLTYLQELTLAWDVVEAGRQSPFAHSWSLGIEEKYYLVWPLLAFGLWAWKPLVRLRGTIVLLLLFAATQSLGRLDSSIAKWHPELVLYPYSNIMWGCLLAILLEDERWFQRLRALGTPLGLVLTLGSFIATQLAYEPYREVFQEVVILHALATTAWLASILTGGGLLTAALSWKPAVFLGRISYGFYLFHGLGLSAGQKLIPAGSGRLEISVLSFVVSALATIVIAYGLALTIERPLVRVGRKWSERILSKQAHAKPRREVFGAERDAGVSEPSRSAP
jgi:peptidoglycan/LPS O-acetylase OafA/YrhL